MAANPRDPFLDPQSIVQAGEKLYRERYQEEYEKEHLGRLVAIEIRTGKAFIGHTSGEAIRQGRADVPNGVFYLLRVGAPAAFRLG